MAPKSRQRAMPKKPKNEDKFRQKRRKSGNNKQNSCTLLATSAIRAKSPRCTQKRLSFFMLFLFYFGFFGTLPATPSSMQYRHLIYVYVIVIQFQLHV